MDNLTHTLTGVLLARAGLNRLTPRATWIAVTAANLPDIDIVVGPWSIDYLNYHRHLTHSFFVVPLVAFAALVIVEGVTRLIRPKADKLPWVKAWLVATIAELTHPLLDLTNSYGVRTYLPFSADWYAWDFFNIVEPWLLIMLLAFVAAPTVYGLLDTEPGSKTFRNHQTARVGLALLIVFGIGKGTLHGFAIEMLNARHQGDLSVQRIAAFPTSLIPWVWTGYIETEKYHQVVTMDLLENHNSTVGDKYFKPSSHPALDAVRAHPLARDYLNFARYNVTTIFLMPRGARIEMRDIRFGDAKRAVFKCVFQTDEMNRVTSATFEW